MNASVHTCQTPLEWLAADLAGNLSGIDDRARWALAGGDVITVTLQHDGDGTLMDDDYFGRVEWQTGAEYEPDYRWSTGWRNHRPDGFDGNAEVVATGRGSRCWWQPPADVERGDEHFPALRAHVRGWFNDDWHYCGIVVEVKGDRRSLDRDGSLWGIESNSNTEYLAEVIRDLLTECHVTDADISAETEPAHAL